MKKPIRKLPDWLKRPMPSAGQFVKTKSVLDQLGQQTICVNANCPNKGECWARGTATVLMLGNICTRNCKFCSVATGKPAPPEAAEPQRIARMVENLKIKYLVITSVDRDDLPDGGAEHFADVMNTVRARVPDIRFELLVPDFKNCQAEALKILDKAAPFVFGHRLSLRCIRLPGPEAIINGR